MKKSTQYLRMLLGLMIVCGLLGCDMYSDDAFDLEFDFDGPDASVQTVLYSVDPPAGSVLKSGDTVTITVFYSIGNYNKNKWSADLCFKEKNGDFSFSDGDNAVASKDLNAQSGYITLTYVITDSFLSNGNVQYPYIFYVQIYEWFILPSWNNSSVIIYY